MRRAWSYVRDMVDGPIIPTPGAVMEATKLLYECIGDLIVLDVGGATTDLHSVTEASDEISRILVSPEPKAKRTVEGDLGVFVNMKNIMEVIGEEKLAEELSDLNIPQILETYKAIPKTPEEVRFVERLAKEAVLRAVGTACRENTICIWTFRKNDLGRGKRPYSSQIYRGDRRSTDAPAPSDRNQWNLLYTATPTDLNLYPGEHAKILVDNDYIMASLGVLSKKYKDAAIKLLEKSLDYKFI